MSEVSEKDPIVRCILDMVGGGRSVSPQEVAQAFYRTQQKPGMPADGEVVTD